MTPTNNNQPDSIPFKLKPKVTSIISFFILVTLGYFILKEQHSISEAKEKLEMEKMLSIVRRNIDQVLQNAYTVTVSLAQTVNDAGDVKNFDTVAEQLLNNNQNISVVQLVPGGTIKYIYPLKGNEAALGLNLFKTNHTRKEALKALERKNIYFAGPLELVQGGKAIIGRIPIHRNGKFWGFSAAIISFDSLFNETGLENFKTQDYFIQLSKINPVSGKEEFFLNAPTNFEDSIKETIKLPEGNWKIHLVKLNSGSVFSSLYPTIILWLIFSICSSALLYFLIKKPSDLQKVIIHRDEQISKNEIELQSIFDNAALGIAVLNLESGSFIKANQQLLKILECSKLYLEKTPFYNFVHQDDNSNFQYYLNELKKEEVTKFTATKKLISKNNKVIWANITVSPMHISSQGPESYILIIEDITDRKKENELFKENESRFKSLFEDSPIPLREEDLSEVQLELKRLNICNLPSTKIYRYFKDNPDHLHRCVQKIKVLNVNKESLKLRSVATKEEFQDHYHEMIVGNSQRILIKQLIAICKNQTFFSGENTITNSKGENKDIQVKWYVVPGFEKNYKRIFISTEDITENKLTERELKKSHKILIERNKRLLEFSYIISHNLRSHTSNIQTIISSLEYIDDPEEKNDMLKMLKEVSDALDETIHNLNEITSIRTNLDIAREPLNLEEYIGKTLAILSSKIKKTETTIFTNVKPDLTINYNPAYLESILLNLISNAIKYADENRKPVIKISVKYFKGNVRLIIKDNGIGIDLNKHGNKIFGMYKTFTNRPDSKGIGLFITKNQVEAMGGRIEVESEVNVGTTFKIFFNEA